MPVADVLARLRSGRLTSQQIADFMLAEDQQRRRALAAGDGVRAAEHTAELDRLTTLLHRS